MTQPIGSAPFKVKDLSISIPDIVTSKQVPVNGTATGKSVVDIYDNGTLIGKTTALANGSWAATCELDNPYPLSTHQISAKVTTPAGLEMQTETQRLTYDPNSLQISKVVMYHWNPEMNKNYEIIYDFQKPTTTAQKYTYYIFNKVFTFTIDFTGNDPELIHNVMLYVKTGGGSWIPLEPKFDQKQGRWVASGEFGEMYDGNIPKNVAVSYTYEGQSYYEASDIVANFTKQNDKNLLGELNDVDALFSDNLSDVNDIADEVDSILSNSIGLATVEDDFDYENATEDELYTLLGQTLEKLAQYDFSNFIK